jgi:holo-[acyl-carrier protein] synthase
MIIGLGIDVVDIPRFVGHLSATPRMTARLFSALEQQSSPHSLAGKLAAKEALFKALSPSFVPSWLDVEVNNSESGKPYFTFQESLLQTLNGSTAHLSISHDAGIASAVVVLEK